MWKLESPDQIDIGNLSLCGVHRYLEVSPTFAQGMVFRVGVRTNFMGVLELEGF